MEIKRRSWALPDEWNFDSKRHLDFISHVFDHRPEVDHLFSPYAWNYKVEDRRLLMQNNCPPYSWGDGHYERLIALRNTGFIPETIVQIGTGRDASLTTNLYKAFPDVRELIVVELSSEKINGARETLQRSDCDLTKIQLIEGDVIRVLPGLGATVDLIENQNLLMHIPERGEGGKNIPPVWNEEERGLYPTLERIIEVITRALRPGGYTMIGDLSVREWDISSAFGFEDDPEIQEKVKRSKEYIANAIKLSWDVRGANAWRGAEEIAQKVTQLSGEQLVLEPTLSSKMGFTNIGPDHPFTAITAYIPPTLSLAVSSTRVSFEEALKALSNIQGNEDRKKAIETRLLLLCRAEKMLWNEGAKYARLLQDTRICTTLPTIYWQFFRKI